MAEGVSLRALVEELEMLGDGIHAFLNCRTGELYSSTEDLLHQAEDNDVPDEGWEVEILNKLKEILGSPDWSELPKRPTHEDYRIMERFCLERCEGDLQDELLSAITGRGAFGRFKDCIVSNGVRDDWFAFRRTVLTEDAKSWLEANEISYMP